MNPLRYLIVGTGGTGGSIGAFLALNGKDVTFLSRGKNLEVFKEEGMFFKSGIKGDHQIKDGTFIAEEDFKSKADVIFVCVKSYSVKDIIPILQSAAHAETVIIPIMNGYNMGASLSEHVDLGHTLEGCIYISAFVESPGTIVQLGGLFKLVFGPKKGQVVPEDILKTIYSDLSESGIEASLSGQIQVDTFKKFTFISAYAACGAYYDIEAVSMQKEGNERETFISLCREIEEVGQGLGLNLDIDVVETNLNILHSLTPDTTASMQKDMKAGKAYEMDGLVFEVLRLAKTIGVSIPEYEKIGNHFGYKN